MKWALIVLAGAMLNISGSIHLHHAIDSFKRPIDEFVFDSASDETIEGLLEEQERKAQLTREKAYKTQIFGTTLVLVGLLGVGGIFDVVEQRLEERIEKEKTK